MNTTICVLGASFVAALAATAPLAPQAPVKGAHKAKTVPPSDVKFAEPVQLHAGGKLLGGGRLYPSPVFRDMNNDGTADLVVGDLIGKITVALRVPGKDPLAFAAETDLKGANGEPINFHNW